MVPKPPRRYIAHNPCEGMVPTKRKGRKRILTDAELATVFRAALEGPDTFSHIVALLILTGQRRGEIASLRTSWRNPPERLIKLPDHITRTTGAYIPPRGVC